MKRPQSIILGLDLASRTGTAVLAGDSKKILHSDSIRLLSGKKSESLCILEKKLLALFNKFPINEVAIEDIFLPVKTSRKTPIWLGELRGVARLVCSRMKLEPKFYPPLKIKMAITGSGRCSKEEMKFLLEQEFSYSFVDDNASDAMAVAYLHLLCRAGNV
ncbi:crossover junction endodeoxyribonuclease RuvC [Candidatus Riflebacteria bacterium]